MGEALVTDHIPVVLVGQTRPEQIGGTASPLSRELVALRSCVFGQEFTTLMRFQQRTQRHFPTRKHDQPGLNHASSLLPA